MAYNAVDLSDGSISISVRLSCTLTAAPFISVLFG